MLGLWQWLLPTDPSKLGRPASRPSPSLCVGGWVSPPPFLFPDFYFLAKIRPSPFIYPASKFSPQWKQAGILLVQDFLHTQLVAAHGWKGLPWQHPTEFPLGTSQFAHCLQYWLHWMMWGIPSPPPPTPNSQKFQKMQGAFHGRKMRSNNPCNVASMVTQKVHGVFFWELGARESLALFRG